MKELKNQADQIVRQLSGLTVEELQRQIAAGTAERPVVSPKANPDRDIH